MVPLRLLTSLPGSFQEADFPTPEIYTLSLFSPVTSPTVNLRKHGHFHCSSKNADTNIIDIDLFSFYALLCLLLSLRSAMLRLTGLIGFVVTSVLVDVVGWNPAVIDVGKGLTKLSSTLPLEVIAVLRFGRIVV